MPDINLENALHLAADAAKRAGEVQKQKYEDKNLSVRHKGTIDIVTEVDIECEKLIVNAITGAYPDHDIIAEEGTNKSSGTGYVWIIDPLDGTTNYSHGFPMFCSSIALVYKGEALVGAAYDPLRDELFTAVKGKGALMNGKAIRVSKVGEMDDALLATGFPYDIRSNKRNNLENFNRVALTCQAIRRAGSAVLDLCYVACGRFDGFWEQRLFAWDMAAGALIAGEAGGSVTDMKGKKLDLFGETICAANPGIHPRLLSLLLP